MNLLFEEIFLKISKVGKGDFTLRILIKSIFIFLILLLFAIIVYSVVSGKYVLILVVLGLFIIAETAHFIRKSREKVMINRDAIKKNTGLKNEKSKNKNLLGSASKNKSLLGSAKNKKLYRIKTTSFMM